MKPKPGKANEAAAPAGENRPAPDLALVFRWGTVRTGLMVFAVGWVLVQGAAILLDVLSLAAMTAGDKFGYELEPAFLQTASLVLSLALLAGVVYFVTGMALSLAAPAGSWVRPWAWGIFASLAVSGLGLLLFNLAASRNQEILGSVNMAIVRAQREHGQAGPPPGFKKRLERMLGEQWPPSVLVTLVAVCVGGFCVAKLFFTACLAAVARSFGKPNLAGRLQFYLLVEAVLVAVGLGLLLRERAALKLNFPLALFIRNWYAIGVLSGLCFWFLIYLVQVRRAIVRGLAESRR